MGQARQVVAGLAGAEVNAASPAASPIFVYSLRHPLLRLRSPLAVSLVHDGMQSIAAAYDLDMFGYGDSDSEALDDLRRSVVDLYATLKDNSASLGPLPQRIWEYLSEAVEERHPA
jgi:hypothetical protein